jgi:hypothetical protein
MTKKDMQGIILDAVACAKKLDSHCLASYEWAELERYIDKCFEAEENQTPKMVDYYGDGDSDGEIVYDGAKCPSCGMDFEESDSDWEEPYCHACGQALKWEV